MKFKEQLKAGIPANVKNALKKMEEQEKAECQKK